MADFTFEKRKQDHIRLALDPKTQWEQTSLLQQIQLIPEALPEINLQDVSLKTNSLQQKWQTPLFISSMTAGHEEGLRINQILAEASSAKGWLMGVGSQRKELTDTTAAQEWKSIRQQYPHVKLAANLGLAQVIQASVADIDRLIENLEAVAFFIHLNPLQECLQPEGTPNFKDGLQKIEKLVAHTKIPVIIKEVGCGVSENTALKLKNTGIAALDVSGKGGTHWGRIEAYRSEPQSSLHQVGLTFKDWGLETADSLLRLQDLKLPFELWASGGVRSGLDAAKYLAMGAKMVGIAQPFMKAALQGSEAVEKLMSQTELELKIAMFCTGIANVSQFEQRKVWQWNKI